MSVFLIFFRFPDLFSPKLLFSSRFFYAFVSINIQGFYFTYTGRFGLILNELLIILKYFN